MSTTLIQSMIRKLPQSVLSSNIACSYSRPSVGIIQGNGWKNGTTINNFKRLSCSAYVEVEEEEVKDSHRPMGDLFHLQKISKERLLSKSASIRRTFGPQDNAQALLTLGGPSLAENSSFDPQYDRAREWIHHHAVGPTVQSPVLLTGLVGALVEAALPSSIVTSSTMTQVRPLIVGLEVEAKIIVQSVGQNNTSTDSETKTIRDDRFQRDSGYEITLGTQVTRVRDGAIIAEGNHSVWIADYGL
uniref:Uncharacterized protein n=1 Tax=Eucampia antarctica TaxID=49252 RepID=A0A7S2RPL8_9STRA|mmetsp:Transcript_24551/g.23599  ORF Transcript_24551/g.23599 Transcript_24551/m.23599 type:complete len:245 (+) Transcript_24551:145-879(+)|eukprot:CAMPEP_0197836658 /NCGR_PEP_ID=MMETSP1437-20131217/29640_1 /TAXON_ID=49252 ORGANISM="Eucampia antarctica, Strain CCMP1452" /NCGR_SAMPLE_ID=MMETSP1437 /ASSEMBLY_ACC=CAM_ASM_001096 /LENGTH=244 /DNA_ID=CAMNT_0043443007 /DNA_START=131 /DNA_END=865 /DNA_ORIENTATION=+